MPSITNMRKPILKALCCLAALMLLIPNAMAFEDNKHLTMGMISVQTTALNPLMSVEREFRSLTALVYEGLISLGDDYRPEPALARSWDASQDGGTWYFHLRENVAFHDGTPLTAHDVVATVQTILAQAQAEENKGTYASLKHLIKDIQANDNTTVVIKTERKNYGFLFAMNFPILKKDEVMSANPQGTGPYKVSQFEAKDFLHLTKNDAWWNGVPQYDSIMTIFHNANRELISSFEYNRVDVVATRSLNAAQFRSGTTSLNLSYRTQQLETLMLNNKAKELSDVSVRKAIRHALNIQDILSVSYLDMALRANTPMMPGTWMYNDLDAQFDFNPEKAKSLLESAGWDELDEKGVRTRLNGDKRDRLHLRFLIYEEPDNSVRAMAANRIVQALANVGIECKLELVGFTTAKSRLKAANYDIALVAFNMDSVPDPGFLLMTNNTGNYARYTSKEMDTLFAHLRATTNEETYRNTLMQIQSLYAEDCPFISLYYRKGAIITRKLFTNARDLREPDIFRGLPQGIPQQ